MTTAPKAAILPPRDIIGNGTRPLTRKTALATYLLLAALLALLAYPAGVWLVRSWLTNPYYTHGLLIPPLAALLIWGQRRALAAQPRQGGSWLGLLTAAVALGVALWAMSWQNYAVALLALVGLTAGLLLYLEGWPRLRLLLFPLLFLALAVPLLLVSLLAIIGGIYALQRKKWGLALAGSIAAFFPSPPLGIAAIVFTAISQDDFQG